MKEITIYECADGTRFDKKEDAMNYDVLLLKCSEVENSIGKERELEYDQFIQRNAEAVKSAWIKFCDIVADAIPDWAKRAKECGAGTRHRTHIGRIISDYNIRCLCSLYFRFDCIDDNGREYQQPYFANGHHNEATKEVVDMDKKKTCGNCLHRERWECGSKIIQYCRKLKSNRTFNGLKKIKCNQEACMYYERDTEKDTEKED